MRFASRAARPDLTPPPKGKSFGSMRFRALHGWRGVCAVFVVLLHLPMCTPPFDWFIVRQNYLLVDFFFVLSGFVISHAYNHRLGTSRTVTAFAIRRFGRLWPLHCAVLSCLVALEIGKSLAASSYGPSETAPFSRETTLPLMFASLAMVQIFRPEPLESWNGPSWSISAEFWTCLVFALVHLVFRRRRHAAACAICIGSIVGLWVCSRRGMDVVAGLAMLRCLLGFFLGTLIYDTRLWRATPIKSGTLVGRQTLFEVASVLAVVLLFLLSRDARLSFLAPAVFAALVVVFAREGGGVSRLLATPPFQHLGRISYSIYLVHTLLLMVAMRGLHALDRKFDTGLLATRIEEGRPDTGGFLLPDHPVWAMVCASVFLAVVIAFAAFTFRFVERPATQFFRRFEPGHVPKAEPGPRGRDPADGQRVRSL